MHIGQFIERHINPLVRLPIAGLDISDTSAKYLAFEPKMTGGSHRLSASGEFQIPDGIIAKGEIQNEEELVRVFLAWRAAEKRIPHGMFFVSSLPEEKSFLRVIQLPNMKEEEVARAIRWEIEANIPLAFEELVYDYELITPNKKIEASAHPDVRPVASGPAVGAYPPDHLDVVVTAFPKQLIESYMRALRRAGFSLAALELESQAIARSVIADFHDNAVRIIADIGRTRTSFIVCIGGVIVFTTTIELGGELFEEHLAKAFHVSREEARLMKVHIGLNRKERDGAVFDALLPIMAVLADELGKVVEYYSRHAEHMHGVPPAIGSIMLVGGDASLSGLATYLASALRLPVALGDPFAGMYAKNRFTLPPLPRNEALAFATTVGLALRNIRS